MSQPQSASCTRCLSGGRTQDRLGKRSRLAYHSQQGRGGTVRPTRSNLRRARRDCHCRAGRGRTRGGASSRSAGSAAAAICRLNVCTLQVHGRCKIARRYSFLIHPGTCSTGCPLLSTKHRNSSENLANFLLSLAYHFRSSSPDGKTDIISNQGPPGKNGGSMPRSSNSSARRRSNTLGSFDVSYRSFGGAVERKGFRSMNACAP